MTWDIGWHATFYGLFYENRAIPSIRFFFSGVAICVEFISFVFVLRYVCCMLGGWGHICMGGSTIEYGVRD